DPHAAAVLGAVPEVSRRRVVDEFCRHGVQLRGRAGKIRRVTMWNVARRATLAACGLLVASVLVAGGLAWRLSRGPIVLDSFTPRLESELSAPDGSVRVSVGSTAIEWDPIERDVGLRVHDLRVFGAGGAPVATVPNVAVGISPGALLLGQVVPRWIEAIGVHIQLGREPSRRNATR